MVKTMRGSEGSVRETKKEWGERDECEWILRDFCEDFLVGR